jgi:hypothetical protein
LPILWEHMMTLPELVLIKRREQISDDGERMKIALKSLKQESGRLFALVVLLSERPYDLSRDPVVPARQPE